MQLKITVSVLLSISMFALGSISVSAGPAEEVAGPYVDSLWWQIIWSDDARMNALLTHDADAGLMPRPEDLQTLEHFGFTITKIERIGYTFLMENNRVWPFGTPTGGDADPENWRAVYFRKGIHRLIDKDACAAIYAPLMGSCDWWLPPGQPAWINPDEPAPAFDPAESAAMFDAGGFVEGTTPNPYYDPDWHLASAQYLRIDPLTGEDLEPFEYYTISPYGCPYLEMPLKITSWMRKMGLQVDLVCGTWLGMVIRLTNDVLDDYQLMSGVGIAWGSRHPNILYDLLYSENLPLWCFSVCNYTELDYWALKMMTTLDLDKCKEAAFKIQEYLNEYEPYLPLLLWNRFTAFNSDILGIVNMKGYGALAPRNRWTKMLIRKTQQGGGPIRWILLGNPNTLNPLMAETYSDRQVLEALEDRLIELNPYTHEYMPWVAQEMPLLEPWTGPEGEVGMTMEFTLRHDIRTYQVRSPCDYEDYIDWKQRDRAYSSDNKYAWAKQGGANVTYGDYGFTEIAGYVPIKVEVGIEAHGDGDDYVAIEVSWDRGTTWSNPATYTPPTSDPDTPYYIDFTDSRTWRWDELSNQNFRVRLTKQTVGGAPEGKIHVDWLPVRVTRSEPGMTCDIYWHDGVQVTAEDCVFALNLLRTQEVEKYRSIWEPIDHVDLINTTTFKVYYKQRFSWAFEGISDVALLCPKHIWEPFIAGSDGVLWTDDDRHHSEWMGWEEAYMEDLQHPGMNLTKLVGCGPFIYHHGGWKPGEYVHVEANRQYFAGRICPADVDLNQIVDLHDLFKVIDAVGSKPGDPSWDPACDIAPPAQTISLEEIYFIVKHFGQRWGPSHPYT